MAMYPNKNINFSQFYSVPPQPYSQHSYPYSVYLQSNHTMNAESPTQTSATPASYLDDVFTNGTTLPGLSSHNAANFPDCYQKQTISESDVVSLPKYFRCTLGEGPTRYRRERTVFTQNQLRVFEKRFEAQKYLSTQERFELARSLGLSALQVKTWFQNRRMKWKKTTKGLRSQHVEKAKQAREEENQAHHEKTTSNQLTFL